jgi:hypothetical protein
MAMIFCDDTARTTGSGIEVRLLPVNRVREDTHRRETIDLQSLGRPSLAQGIPMYLFPAVVYVL